MKALAALDAVIATGGTDYARFGPAFGVGFEASRLVGASVVWLNHRWFAEMGVDLVDAAVRRAVEHWLLREYGYLVPGRADPAGIVDDDHRLRFQADRYGLTGGGWHGGSGRCGYRGRFHVKGIGQTPLVSPDADPLHASGMMMLWEALMETLTSEVAAAELPYGAIPTVAIIDAGFDSAVPGHGENERRALMVRPNFVRPGHMERSIFFHDGTVPNQAQTADANRVRCVIESLLEDSTDTEGFLRQIFERDARQLGAAHAHRLWLGIFGSSNRAITGALADFGACRSVPDWRAHVTVQPEQFGRELPHLLETLRSLLFYFNKYGGRELELDPVAMTVELQAAAEDGFRNACSATVGCGRAVSAALFALFQRQQRESIVVGSDDAWSRPWLPTAEQTALNRASVEAHEFVALVQREEGDRASAVLARLARWFLPRPSLTQENMTRALSGFVHGLTGTPAERMARVERFLWQQLSSVRRHWPEAPASLAIEGQACGPGIDLLFGLDRDRQRRGTWAMTSLIGPWCSLSAKTATVDLPGRRQGIWFDETEWKDLVESRKWSALAAMEQAAYRYP